MKIEPIIYLVDDDADIRSAIGRAMKLHGYRVESFETAESFLEVPLAAHSCIVLDVNMPGISGFQLQQLLSARANVPPIIFLTGHADVPSAVNAMKLGASNLLTKPVRTQDLLTAIEAALRLNRAAVESAERIAALQANYEDLTPREREVFDLVIRGRLNKQIAFELGTTERTVKAHRQKVMSKMHAQTVQSLMSIAGELGLLAWDINDE